MAPAEDVDVVAKFLEEFLSSTHKVLIHCSTPRNPVPAATEVVDATLSRYQTMHPNLFTKDMTISVSLACWCGQCETPGILFDYSRSISMLIVVHGFRNIFH